MTNKITFKVVGDRAIHCNGCERSIEIAIKQMPEVGQVSADRNTQLIEVTLSADNGDNGKVKTELNYLGYQVEAL
jgi:copper chaperone CopZ